MAGLLSPPRIDSLISSADVLRSKKPGSYLNGSISSYTPSVSEGAEQKITGLLSYVMPRREAAKLAHKVASFADFTPVGDAVTAAQAGQDFRQGNILSGLGNTAMAAIGVVPGVGDVAAKGIRKGIRAYHGSPHDFDRFSLSKIGTGEGAQAYGHGLYFAENEAVARQYRDNLSADVGFSYSGQHNLNRDQIQELANQKYGKRYLDNVILPAGIADQVIDAKRYGGDGARLPAGSERRRVFDDLMSSIEHSDPGRMYEVNINADPDSLLDWDKPIAKQSEQVQAGVREYLRAGGKYPMDRFDQFAASSTGANVSLRQPGQVEAIRSAGIPGLKYLDQGSRLAGDGSRNFVIFDDSIIDILNKY